MDIHTFASLAQVRILLIPIGFIPQSSFDTISDEIRSYEAIKLAEIPAESKDEKASTRFLPNHLSKGNLHLSFPTHPPPRSHSALFLLQPSHFPLAVIAIATCSDTVALEAIYGQFDAALVDIFSEGMMYPLVRACWVFEENEGSVFTNTEAFPGLVIVPRIKNRTLHIGTLLGDLCSRILIEFGILIEALENPIGNEHLNNSLMPSLPPLSELPSPLSSLEKNQAPGSSFAGYDSSRSTFTLGSAPALKRNSTIPSNVRSDFGNQVSKKRISAVGVSSSHGRLSKLYGDFYLLGGNIDKATKWYRDAVTLFRASQDSLWYASALEGMACAEVIEAWLDARGLNTSASTLKEPWSDVSDKMQQAINLYSKIQAPGGEQTQSLITLLYCESVLRQTRLLYSVWSAKGWGPLAFTTMLQPGPKPFIPPTLSVDEKEHKMTLERLSLVTGIPRSTISSSLSQVHGPWLLHLGQRERISILEAIASFYACLGYKRKEAYILREILGCILDLIVCGREEDGFSHPSGVLSTSGLGIQNSVQGPSWGALGIRVSESTYGNGGLLLLLKYICKVLGINLELVGLVTDQGVRKDQTSLDNYDKETMEEFQETCGWPELQVGVVREAVAIAEALPDFPTVAQFALSSLKALQGVLSPSDQYHLYSTATRALVTAHRRGEPRVIEYWSGRPLVSISITPMPEIFIPLEKPRSIRHNTNDLKPLIKGLTDPFLYNPRRAIGKFSQGKTIVAQNGVLEFVVTLQNPYIFDLELKELSLSTSGVEFESKPIHVVIPAGTFHQVVLSGRPLEMGTLTVRGCTVQMPGGQAREYILPLYTPEEEERLSRKRRVVLSESDRFKHTGLDRYPWNRPKELISSSETASSPFQYLECKIVPDQPLLRIRRSSVTHGALMLYDGERSTIRLTLENISSIRIDFMHLTFEDSTIEPAQTALNDGNLSVFDTYETEYSLMHNPVFSWDQDETISIEPNHNLTLILQCFGKVGCTSGRIHISYAYSEDPNLHESDVFYVRQVSCPLMVTVYHMLECSGMDILQLPTYPISHVQGETNAKAENFCLVGARNDVKHCLFSIEVRNTYGSPFDVTLSRYQNGETTMSSTATIPPGSVSRIVIPVDKILLSEEVLSQPIPTLSDRQFIVTQSSMSRSEERIQRELFWYREELFKIVSGRWRETGGLRSGELSFRDQRLTLHMLEAFRLEIANISLIIECDDGAPTDITDNRQHYYPKANEFVRLRSRITNLMPVPMVFTVDYEVNPAEHMVYEGVLTDLPVGQLQGGETREIVTCLCFLAHGRFEVLAKARNLSSPDVESREARAYAIADVKEDT